jgi:hypothetical protein
MAAAKSTFAIGGVLRYITPFTVSRKNHHLKENSFEKQ